MQSETTTANPSVSNNLSYDFLAEAKKLAEEQLKLKSLNSCPNCGFCPHCGRGDYLYYNYPDYYHPYTLTY